MHLMPHRDVHLCVQLCEEGRDDMGSHVGMQTYTDACTYSNQGMEPKEG